MKIRYTIPRAKLADVIPSSATVAEAAGRGVFNLVKGHLAERNNTTRRRPGWRKSGYWADAARSVREPVVSGSVATVEIDKEGVALHYHGGTVRPKKKALAIPINPLVADIYPSEKGELDLVKTKKNAFLADPMTKEFLYLLVPSVTIKADATVLPTDEAITHAAVTAVKGLFE